MATKPVVDFDAAEHIMDLIAAFIEMAVLPSTDEEARYILTSLEDRIKDAIFDIGRPT